jgi:polysaccharide export outer membrane protein
MHRVKVAIIGIACAFLVACGAGPKLGEGSSAVTVATNLPPPDKTGMSVDLSNYRLGPRDDIKIEVFGAPELTREGEIDAAGNFAMPLVGSVAAGGKTPAELASAITSELKGRYLKNPQVSVNIVKAQGQTFTVDGAVKVPGVYPIVGKMTLQEAVATAKGADDSANIGNVVVFRTVNDRKMAALFNLASIRAGQIEDPAIYGNDIIVVGESATRRFLTDFQRLIPSLGSFVPI